MSRKFEFNLDIADVTCTLLDDGRVRYEIYNNNEYVGEVITGANGHTARTAAETVLARTELSKTA